MHYSTKYDFVVELAECSQGLLRFLESYKAISFELVVLFWQFCTDNNSITTKKIGDLLLGEVFREVGDVESSCVDFQWATHVLFILLR